MAGSSITENKVLSLVVKDADATVKQKPVKLKVSKAKKDSKVKTIKLKTTKPIKAKTAKPQTKKTKVVKKVTKEDKIEPTTPTPVAKLINKDELIRSIKREPLGHLLIEHMLRDAGFRGVVSTDKQLLDTYATDESIFSIRPQIVLQPKNQKDIETAVKVLGKETKRFPSLSLTPRAAGTGLSGGSLTDSIVVDVQKYLTDIDEPKEVNDKITITVGPGAMWRDVEKKLKTLDAYIPSFPASKDICAIGGAVANNCAGPDSLRYGHMADWIESLDITLNDGHTYTIAPINFKEYKKLIKQKNALSEIAKSIFTLIEKNEAGIQKAKPKTKKNSAGYALWNVFNTSVAEFKKGNGTFDLTRLVSGSQGTVGIITSVTIRAHKIAHNTSLIVIPVFDLASAGAVVLKSLEYSPVNVEIFDSLTYDLAMKNPNFFRTRIDGMNYYRVLLSMYTLYHVRYKGKIPEFTLLVTIDNEALEGKSLNDIVRELRELGTPKARLVSNATEREMLWQIRRASYSLSKFQDPNKRPAAFLEDMTVPPKNLARFFVEIKRLLKKYNLIAAVHGHGGNGHFHFYPLLDFTNNTTPALVVKMAEEFFAVAVKYGGNICGEHNDGIIRTPHLSKMFSKQTLDWFKMVEHTFDPDDIFNPGKKVNPRFDIKDSIRKTN